jgi:hypothetical protein
MEILRPRYHFKVNRLNYFIVMVLQYISVARMKTRTPVIETYLLHALPWASKGHIFLTCIGVLVLHIVNRNAAYRSEMWIVKEKF